MEKSNFKRKAIESIRNTKSYHARMSRDFSSKMKLPAPNHNWTKQRFF